MSRVLALSLASLAVVGTALVPGASARHLSQFGAEATGTGSGTNVPVNQQQSDTYVIAVTLGDTAQATIVGESDGAAGTTTGSTLAQASSLDPTEGAEAGALAQNLQTGRNFADSASSALAFAPIESALGVAQARADSAAFTLDSGNAKSASDAYSSGFVESTADAYALSSTCTDASCGFANARTVADAIVESGPVSATALSEAFGQEGADAYSKSDAESFEPGTEASPSEASASATAIAADTTFDDTEDVLSQALAEAEGGDVDVDSMAMSSAAGPNSNSNAAASSEGFSSLATGVVLADSEAFAVVVTNEIDDVGGATAQSSTKGRADAGGTVIATSSSSASKVAGAPVPPPPPPPP